MSSVVKALESGLGTAFNISVISDVLSTTPTIISDLPTTRSTQAAVIVTESSVGSTITSAIESSSSQTSNEVAKTSKTKNITTSVSASPTASSAATSVRSISASSSSSAATSTSVSSIAAFSSISTISTNASLTSDLKTIQSSPSVSSTSTSPTSPTTSTTLSTSVTMAPIPQSTIASASTTVTPHSESNAGNGPQSHVAAIVVASVMGACILATILYLIFRYCPPVRDRWEAYKEKKNSTGAYRDTTGTMISPSLEKQPNKSRRSFLARNWYWNGTQETVHGEEPGTGLGLGPVTSLRQQALAETSDRPPPRVYATRHSQIGRAVE